MPPRFDYVHHRMNIDLGNLALGFVLGIISSYIASILYRDSTTRAATRKLREKYGHLAGTYVSYRVDNGVETPTGGTIRLRQQPNGSFEADGLHSSGDMDWQSTINMSLEWENTGTGRYKYPAKPDYGTQQLTVLPESRSLHVVGMNMSHGNTTQFIHHWKRKEN